MSGKVLRVSSNDLYGNADERIVRVYACFEHTKYMNNYIVFSIEGNNEKLCYGSIHLKANSLVVFSVRDDIQLLILGFVEQYMNNNLCDYKILDINNMDRVELVSYNEMEYNVLLLDEKSIPRIVIREEVVVKEKKPILVYLIIFILVLFAFGITLLYFKPEWFAVKYKGLECVNNLYDDKIKLNYDVEKNISFDTDDKLELIEVIKTYNFLDSNSYEDFKSNNMHDEYFSNGERYKYIDDELKFRVFYEEDTVIDDYEEMLVYLKTEGYSCIEKVYEK